MRPRISLAWIVAALLLATAAMQVQAEDQDSLVILFNDGHQVSFPMAGTRFDFKGSAMVVSHGARSESYPTNDIARIELNTVATSNLGRGRFLGKWRAGDGNGGHFYITLDRDGEARKTTGPSHGTWVMFEGEARITWDDGWRDVLRKVGSRYEKVAWEPGKTFSDPPSNVAEAENANPEPL